MMRRVGALSKNILSRRAILQARIHVLDDMNMPRGCNEKRLWTCALDGEEHEQTLITANNYAASLVGPAPLH